MSSVSRIIEPAKSVVDFCPRALRSGPILFLLPLFVAGPAHGFQVNPIVEIKCTAVDDETGKPIRRLVLQHGRPDPSNPDKTVWNFGTDIVADEEDRFTIRLRKTTTRSRRIVAEGYLQFLFESLPDKDKLQLEIRLKRGTLVRGKMLDHLGDPVNNASVFAVSTYELNLYGGVVHDTFGRTREFPVPTKTDEDGRFEIQLGIARSIAVSSESLDCWVVPVPPSKDEISTVQKIEVRLPKPSGVKIGVNIKGAEETVEIGYHLLSHFAENYERNVHSTRKIKIKNGSLIELNSLPPGKYQFWRSRMLRFGDMGKGRFLDLTYVELKKGETFELKFDRMGGRRARGIVKLPKNVKLAGVLLYVESVKPQDHPWGTNKFGRTKCFDSQLLAGAPGHKKIAEDPLVFLTDALLPGTYKIRAEGYVSKKPDGFPAFESFLVRGEYVAEVKIKVSKGKAPDMLELELTKDVR